MNMFKKYLAMFLVLCMLLSALPMTVWADETGSAEVSAEETPTEDTSTEEISADSEDSADSGTADAGKTTERLVLAAADTDPVPGHMAEKPADGKTTGEPFGQGVGESNSFRIPALVTLSDGTLVAAADARWNTTYDGGGLDTIVARSSDNGANWDYTFANYLGDNGNEYNGSSSTCFIDPALAVTANDTIYMLVDLYPYGIALNGSGNTAPSTAVGFNADGKLLLSGDNHGSYGYYLDGNTIKATDGTEQAGYYVDAYFNLYTVDGNDTKTYKSNLFFADSPFRVVRTGFLYLTKSTDKGATWSAPTLLNLKRDTEQVCLVGPGRGLVTESGTIIFPVYSYNGSESSQRMGFIYSNDNGSTWKRSANFDGATWSSESAVVELDNGNLRFFYRNGSEKLCYVDYNLTTNTWGTSVSTGIATNSNCQISAITYSKTIDGKQVILVSCPTGPDSAGSNQSGASYRKNGKIFAFTVEADSSLAKVGEVSVTSNNNQFMYSCLAELKNGTVGILYEDKENAWGTGDNCFYTMSYETYDLTAADTMKLTFDAAETPDAGGDENQDGTAASQETVDVTIKVGETKEFAYTNGYTENAASNMQPNTNIATMTVTDNRVMTTVTDTSAFTAGKYFLLLNQRAGEILTDTPLNYATWGANMGLKVAGEANRDSTETWSIYPVTGGYALKRNNKFLTIVPGNTTMEAAAQALTFSYQQGGYWLIYANCLDGTEYKDFYLSDVGGDSWNGALSYTHTGTDSGDNWIIYEVPAPGTDSTVTFEGKTAGTTTAIVGNTTYNITVIADNVTAVENVTLDVGETKTYTDNTGYYVNAANNVLPNTTIVNMTVSGEEPTQGEKELVEVTALEDGKKYLIYNIREGGILTDQPITDRYWNGNYYTGLTIAGDVSVDSTELWKVTVVNGGYYLQNAEGKYLTIGDKSAGVADTPMVLTIDYTANRGWRIIGNGYYLTDMWGNSMDGVYGFTNNDANTPTDGGNYYTIHEITDNTTSGSTTITFEGVTPGKTVAVVGNTQYNITVRSLEQTIDVELMVGETKTFHDRTGYYVNSGAAVANPTVAAMTMTGSTTPEPQPVTTLESGKQYLIVNRETGDVLTDTVITVTGDYGNKTGLDTTGKVSADSAELWTITETAAGYTVVQNGKYLTAGGYYANMSDTRTNLTLKYTIYGWQILDEETSANLADVGTGGYYLSDNVGDGYVGGALGTNAAGSDYVYWDIYEVVPSYTDVTFEGKTVGTTTTKVGYTTYNISVYTLLDITVNYQLDGTTVKTETIQVPSKDSSAVLPSVVTDAAGKYYVPDSATLTLTPGTTSYDVPVSEVQGISATVGVNESETLQLKNGDEDFKLGEGQYVVWTSADSSYVTVSPNYNQAGNPLSTGTIIGNSVTDESVLVTGTVYNADGTIASVQKWVVTVDEGSPNTNTTSKYIYINITRIQNTTVYYSVNGGELVEITDDMLDGPFTDDKGTYYKLKVPLLDQQYTGGFQISFFGAPDEGYALVDMSSTNSSKQYYSLNDHPFGYGSEAWPFLEAYQDYENFDSSNITDGNNANVFKTGDKGVGIRWGLVEGNLSFAKMKAMYTSAIAKGCDGTLVFTKNKNGTTSNPSTTNYGGDDLVTDLEFISTKLPEIDKSLNGVLPVSRKYADYRRYNGTEMTAAVGEYLYFTITITLDLPSSWVQVDEADSRQSTLVFTTAELIDDVLPGAYFYTKDLDKNYDGVIDEQDEGFQSSWIQTTQDIHEALNADWTDEEIEAGKRVLQYFVVYPLTGKDIDKDIVNTVEFEYEYTSRYSGAAESAAHAAGADIHVVGAYMDNVVVDFGQSVSIPDTDGKLGFANVKSTECEYGKITITQNEGGTYILTYTPTCILQDEDHVILYDKDNRSINSFFVIPATTVYYEEGFAFPAITNSGHTGDWDMTTGSWDLTNSKTASVQQTLEMLNGSQQDSSVSNKLYPYGYDPIYNTAAPNGSYAETHTIGDKTRFTFTGDGIQIFANCLPCTDAGCDHKACTSTSGYVSVEVREAVAPYKIVRLAMVNTKVLAGSTEATSGQTGEMNGLPVVSLINLQNMPHGKYIVTIAKIMNTNPVYIEGFRVFNTVKPDPDISPFTIDYEDQPKFYELRDAVLYAVGTNVDGNVEGATEDYVGKVTQQIYDAVQGASAVIIDPEVPYADSETLQDLLDKGPKNELFLYDGQTLTFKVTTDRCMQVGLKSPQGAVPVVITVAKDSAAPTTINKTINSSVDMFYDLVDRPIETAATYTITITNVDDCDTGANDILSVTLLKICDDPNAAFTQLTQGDIENILTGANAPIRIISQPADTEVKMGERFNVEVIAEGDGLKYQWYFRNAGSSTFQKSGVKDNTYDDVMTAARAGREIYCVITDAQGNSVTTETATLIALPETELAIMSQPNDASAKMGERFCVTVEAQGDGLRYTWYWRTKGTEKWNKSGVTDNTYDDVMTVSRHNREVYCVITDACGNTVQSEIATITRLPDVSLAITQQPTDANASMGERFCVTVEAQGDGLRYTWFFRNKGSDIWYKSGVKDNTYDDVMNKSRAGREIYCVITDILGNRVESDHVFLNAVAETALVITQQPINASAGMGERFCVTVEAQGDGLTYTWYFRNAGSGIWHKSGVTDNTYDDVMNESRAGREIYCVITDALGNRVETDHVFLNAVAETELAITGQPTDASAAMGERFCVTVEAQGDGLRYTWYFKNAGTDVWHKSGVTDNTYDDVMNKSRAGREIYCVITDVCGNTVTTVTVTLVCTEGSQLVTAN